jgi:uncharacterized LabA/DUF88 family protein
VTDVTPEFHQLREVWDTLNPAAREKLIYRGRKLAQCQATESTRTPVPINSKTLTHLNALDINNSPHQGNFHRAMVFVDGENLSIRYGEALRDRNQSSAEDTVYVFGVLVWRPDWRLSNGMPMVVRSYYYTSSPGGEEKRLEAERKLKAAGILAPRVFSRVGNRSKRVDVALCTDMLTHSSQRHFDVAVLITGDGDFIPLVHAVQSQGISVQVWALSNGLSEKLRLAADKFMDLDPFLLGPPPVTPAA